MHCKQEQCNGGGWFVKHCKQEQCTGGGWFVMHCKQEQCTGVGWFVMHCKQEQCTGGEVPELPQCVRVEPGCQTVLVHFRLKRTVFVITSGKQHHIHQLQNPGRHRLFDSQG